MVGLQPQCRIARIVVEILTIINSRSSNTNSSSNHNKNVNIVTIIVIIK